ncbi:bifunctional UDP-N-acetylglucosamine diphosphorylase/glucosamine-1-phosphate N-acetyltransferase GlmU [Desulfovibrio litoralis]|uniref:Bifunctional protein GlmU n=1 Tax=Desulfovibrio litoralis DSM 11393 TaxID=1121455 RepID=A0A1M7SE90_9BACT|nr:bifunctional UDP-N-acetylglucosamine diphosphorylase/glucosamine-1-phosphate N-acetyltransferase GlmU [Desulfovibrio litoralis]SHN56799.1 bifunctional UDP-N-acetylglucosamine pyrophosphorylase / Glucosamine-1-phosphate N-acetyltransferase [Desulfovibrio litoralis DSM 11393]
MPCSDTQKSPCQNTISDTFALILAAGKGTRMHSPRPKVLQTLLGDSMLEHVYTATKNIFAEKIYAVIGHGAEQVEKEFKDSDLKFILQSEQLGTGHAVQVSLKTFEKALAKNILIINGDTPLISSNSLQQFLEFCQKEKSDLAFISLSLNDPGSFGRVIYKGKQVTGIIEAKDYDPKIYGDAPKEVNAGIYYLNLEKISPLFSLITKENKSAEYYLTDLISLAYKQGLNVNAFNAGNNPELLGINSPLELVEAEDLLRLQVNKKLLQQGVIIHNPNSVEISTKAIIEPGVEIFGPCRILGKTTVKKGALIEAFTSIINSTVLQDAQIRSYSHIEQATVGEKCIVGPYARLRPESILEENSHVGNFVELKKTKLGKNSKANHLSYLGDSEIGNGVNIGAGTITCNYDGKNKYKTIIQDNAFIGSNTALVAPVTIEKNALIAAGSTITKNVPENNLGIARERQTNLARKK